MTVLFPYQTDGAQWLAKVGRGLLADEPGLGKTAQAIVAACQVDAKRILVICPASVVENWKKEIRQFNKGSRKYQAFSYDALAGVNADRAAKAAMEAATAAMAAGHAAQKTAQAIMMDDPDMTDLSEIPVAVDAARVATQKASLALKGVFRPLDQIVHKDTDLIILDESHFLKGKDALRTRTIFGQKRLGADGAIGRVKNVFCLSGTPMPNAPDELWSMLNAVFPAALDANTEKKWPKIVRYEDFVNRFCLVKSDGFALKIVGGKNHAELRERIKPFVLRRKKDQVLKDLPPIRFDALPLAGKIDLKGAEAEYALAAKALEEGGIEALGRIASHVTTLRRLTGAAKVIPVTEWVKDQLEGSLEKIVLFAQHKDVLQGLHCAISRFTKVAMIDGSTTDRQAQVDRFQNDPAVKVFIGQIQAAGTGITLTAASDLVFVESDWVPANNEQAAMRIHRIGAKNACTVRFATIAGSIDEQIQRACARKLEDIRALFV